MKNLPKAKRDRLVLIVLCTLMILVALWQGVINLQRKGLVTSKQRLLEEESKLTNAERLVGSVGKLEEDIKKKAAELKVLESSMASGDMYSWMIMKVNQLKAGYDVDIPQISREVPMEVAMIPNFPYSAALFNVRGKAHYHDLGRFLAAFEQAFPYARVQNIDLEPAAANKSDSSEESDASEKLSFRMEIVTLVNPSVQ